MTDAGERLPVFRSVWRAYRDTLGRPVSLLKVAALPALAGIAGLIVLVRLPLWDHPAAVFSLAVFMLPLCYLSLAWLRHSLLGLPARLAPQGLTLASYGKLLGHCLLWVLLVVILPGGLLFGALSLFISLVDRPWDYAAQIRDGTLVFLIWLGLGLLAVVPTCRLFLAAPAIAAGKPASPLAAWRNGKGLGLRLGAGLLSMAISLFAIEVVILFTLLFCFIGIIEVSGWDSVSLESDDFGAATATVLMVVDTLLRTVVGSELLAIAYRHATGWQSGRQEILERFE